MPLGGVLSRFRRHAFWRNLRMRRLRLALIGTGRAGLIHGANIVRRIERGVLVALCDASPANLSAAATELGVANCHADYRAVCADPTVDAVVIVTPRFSSLRDRLRSRRGWQACVSRKTDGALAGRVHGHRECLPRCRRQAADRFHAAVRREFFTCQGRALFQRKCHRFFEKHMLARRGGGAGDLAVEKGGRDDDDCVDGGIGAHRPVVGMAGGDAELLRSRRQVRGVRIAEGDEFSPVDPAGDIGTMDQASPASAYECKPQWTL